MYYATSKIRNSKISSATFYITKLRLTQELLTRLYDEIDFSTYERFIELGAKWQQEQIGKSEFLQKLRGTLSDAEARRLIFEQFKNDRL